MCIYVYIHENTSSQCFTHCQQSDASLWSQEWGAGLWGAVALVGCLSLQETPRPDLSLPKAIIIPMTPHSPCSSIASAMDQLSDDQLLRGAKVANLPSSHTLCMYNGHQKEGTVVKRLWWRPENRRVKGDSSLRRPEEWESKSIYIRLENIWILGILPVACLHWQLCLLF